MIDALFGSKTRVKLLHLFLNSPGQSFYVREITRKIDEQINSVRRELANLLEVGVITSDNSVDHKLYYEINQRYEFYVPFRAIFADERAEASTEIGTVHSWQDRIRALTGVRLALIAGVLVKGSNSQVDLLIVGEVSSAKVKSTMKDIEKQEARELNYSVMTYDEFYYRLSVRDKFITEILAGKHAVLVDIDNMLKLQK